MKVLNLYACLGGNRLLWDNCEVTAVELDPELARMYQERFPNDTVIVGDAHQYLLDHYKEYDFVWSSPPCPTHSRARFWNTKAERAYPDFKLYEEIVFLQHHFPGRWVVENVVPYYEPMLKPTRHGRHLFWSNFLLPKKTGEFSNITEGNLNEWQEFHKVDISSYIGTQRKDKILRNLVHYDTGKHIFDIARGIYNQNNEKQKTIFDEL